MDIAVPKAELAMEEQLLLLSKMFQQQQKQQEEMAAAISINAVDCLNVKCHPCNDGQLIL